MNIAILGSGNVGSALANGWQKAGHKVVFGVRNPNSNKAEKAQSLIPYADMKSIGRAVEGAEVVVVCTPPQVIGELIELWGDVSNKIIVDTTNTLRPLPLAYPTAYAAIKGLTTVEHVVKCFNSTGYENMKDPVFDGVAADMFAAGNSQKAKEVAGELALSLGFANCYDFGGDDKVELLEKLASCWINLSIIHGHGRQHAFKVMSR